MCLLATPAESYCTLAERSSRKELVRTIKEGAINPMNHGSVGTKHKARLGLCIRGPQSLDFVDRPIWENCVHFSVACRPKREDNIL